MATQYAYGTKATIVLNAYWCPGCGIPYGLPEGFFDERRKDHKIWLCPNGCQRYYPAGKSDEQKLKESAAREVALNDQLRAAIREGDAARRETLRIRQRVANGVCPCCTRSFGDVRRHMATQHPDFALPGDWKHEAAPFRCSCGHKFDTFRGLRIHQSRLRDDDWDKPTTRTYWSHLTVV